jgi:rhamnogalacturonyl hydrolase YesR
MMKRIRTSSILIALTAVVSVLPGPAQTKASKQVSAFGNWPAGRSPHEIGERVAERLASTPHSNFGKPEPPTQITYPEVATWYGALIFARASHDQPLGSRLIHRFQPLFSDEAHLIPNPVHVDNTVFAAVPLQIYIGTKQSKYLNLGKSFADKQWENPTPEGLTPQTRFWIDDMYMITIAQVQAYRATGDEKYLDRAALEMSSYLDKLQQPNGLFYHAPDAHFFWGRGDGWVAAGMTELLTSLPQNHPRRARIMQSYLKMMKALLQYQDKDGMWHQLLDHPESFPETSCIGMFTFALVTGVEKGWLDAKTYAPAARKGWLALTTYLEPNGDIRNVCEGTGKNNNLQYYLDRKRLTGDLHGQAPILWSATALLQ